MEQFTGKHSKQQFYFHTHKNTVYIAQENVKTFKETVSFHLASNAHFIYSCFSSWALYNVVHIAHGHYGKIQPEYWPITSHVIYLEAVAI